MYPSSSSSSFSPSALRRAPGHPARRDPPATHAPLATHPNGTQQARRLARRDPVQIAPAPISASAPAPANTDTNTSARDLTSLANAASTPMASARCAPALSPAAHPFMIPHPSDSLASSTSSSSSSSSTTMQSSRPLLPPLPALVDATGVEHRDSDGGWRWPSPNQRQQQQQQQQHCHPTQLLSEVRAAREEMQSLREHLAVARKCVEDLNVLTPKALRSLREELARRDRQLEHARRFALRSEAKRIAKKRTLKRRLARTRGELDFCLELLSSASRPSLPSSLPSFASLTASNG